VASVGTCFYFIDRSNLPFLSKFYIFCVRHYCSFKNNTLLYLDTQTLFINYTSYDGTDNISWSAHFASSQNATHPPAITVFLLLFRDNAQTLAMVKHGMNVIQQATEHVRPAQVPVITEGRDDAHQRGSYTSRAQWDHQVTAAALYILQKRAYIPRRFDHHRHADIRRLETTYE